MIRVQLEAVCDGKGCQQRRSFWAPRAAEDPLPDGWGGFAVDGPFSRILGSFCSACTAKRIGQGVQPVDRGEY